MIYFLWIFCFLIVAYLLAVVLMYFVQSKFVYSPSREILETPESHNLAFEQVWLNVEEGVDINGWFVPAEDSEVTVLFVHGNAGNISGRMDTINLFHELGVNFFLYDYRGYGQSTGKPTEEGTYLDALAAWNYLVNERQIDHKKIVIMGRSLGGPIAARLVIHEEAAAAIIESTFTSLRDLGSESYPWVPVRWLLRYHYDTLSSVRKISVPIFMAHSREDQVIPFHHGQVLFEAAREPKTFVELQGAHASGFFETGKKYRDAMKEFLKKYVNSFTG